MKKLIQILLISLLSLPVIATAFDTQPQTLEQKILDQINLARANPWAEADHLGLDPDILRQILPIETSVAWDQSIMPLVINDQLNQAAVERCLDMIDRNYFSLVTPEGETPADRVAATGYQAELLKQEFAAMAFDFYIQPDQAADEMPDSLLLKALKRETGYGEPALLDPEVLEIGVAVRGGTVSIWGYNYNIYVLSIIMARQLQVKQDDVKDLVQCGHLYFDKNSNEQYDQGEGLTGEKVTVHSREGVYSVTTSKDGAYCMTRPEDSWIINICKQFDIQYGDEIEDNPETKNFIDYDYDAWYFECELVAD